MKPTAKVSGILSVLLALSCHLFAQSVTPQQEASGRIASPLASGGGAMHAESGTPGPLFGLETGDPWYNTFYGQNSGSYTTGYYNCFFGNSAGYYNSSGASNIFVGTSAGFYNTSGGFNSFVGESAGAHNDTGSFNSFFGQSAGYSNNTGTGNTFLGAASGSSNTNGSLNTMIGVYADGVAGITNSTALGYQAKVTQNTSVVLGSINGVNGSGADAKVGIGTTAPVSTLNVSSTTTVSPRGITNEQYNNGMDGVQFRARKARGTSGSPAAVQAGDVLGNYVFDGYDGVAFATGAQIRPVAEEDWSVTAHGAYLAFWTTPTGSGTNMERVRITSGGNVGIGVTNPVEKLHVNGSIRATGSIYSQPSPDMQLPDYVFESDYDLMPISDLERFIARERHLPKVPKAADIRENGLNHIEFQMKLLEKIEELTLYTVQQDRRIRELEQIVGRMEKQEK